MPQDVTEIGHGFSGSTIGLHWYHWSVLFLSLLLTFGAFHISDRQVNLKSADQFEFQSQQIVELVKERMVRYEEALWAGVAALKMFPEAATRDDWKRFEASLNIDERFPGINGIGVIHYVPPEKMNAYLAWQRDTMAEYTVHPTHTEPEYWPITYIEPQSANLKAVGLDMAHETNRYTAAQTARSSGLASITGPITLVQDAQKTPGFLFYAPWYSDADNEPAYGDPQGDFMGLVYAPFIMHKLMDGTLENINRLVNFSIHDGTTLLYSEFNQGTNNVDPEPLFTKEVTLELYGRPWHFNLHSTELFRTQQNHTQPFIILIGGLIIDALLFTIFMVLAKSNRNAVNYAKQVTARLHVRNTELESVSKSLQMRNRELLDANSELDQFAFVASHDLKAPLRGINQLALWIEEDSDGALTDTTYKHLELMKNRILRLERLLDDLLAYSRVGRHEVTPEFISIEALVKGVFHLFEHETHFSLTLQSPTKTVSTMVTPLEQILRNLIGNAIKHHDQGEGQIHVTVMQSSDHLHFDISDDGPGIPLEHQKKVFELFHTLRPRDKVEGSGLGLSIIKKILDHYDCTYQIQSDGQRGLTFAFTWPIFHPAKEADNHD